MGSDTGEFAANREVFSGIGGTYFSPRRNPASMTDVDRARGILTPADRRFLRGDVTLGSEQSRYDARYRIRQRTRDALLDCSLLFEHLAERDRVQVFDDDLDGLTDALVDAVAFVYLGATSLDVDPERIVTEGVRRGERRRRGDDCPRLDVEVAVGAAPEERLDHIATCVGSGAIHELDERDLRALARLLAEQDDRAVTDLLESTTE